MGLKKKFSFYLVAFVLLSLLFFLSFSLIQNNHSYYQETRLEWRSWKSHLNFEIPRKWWVYNPVEMDWEEISISDFPSRIDEPKTLRLKAELFSNPKNEPTTVERISVVENSNFNYLYMSGIYGVFQVVHGEEILYNYGWDHRNESESFFFGYPWHIIPIPNSYNEIQIHIYSDKNLIGPFGKIYAGSMSSIFWYLFTESWERIILGVFFLLLGSFTLLFVFDRSVRGSFILFGIFCMLVGIYTITRSPGRLFYYDNHAIWTWLNLFSVYAIPGVLYFFLNRIFYLKKYPILFFASMVHLAFMVVSLLVSLTGMHNYIRTLVFFQYLVVVTGPLVIFQILYTTIVQRKTNQIIILAGMSIFFTMGIHESMVAMGILSYSFTNIYWGMLILIFSMAFVLVRRFTAMNEQLGESNKNLVRLLAIQEELESAKNVQLSLIPQEYPESDRWEILGHYTPMDKVGGDFYDILNEDENSLGIFLSDVSGHGLSTALLSSMVKVAFSQQISNMDSPAKLLSDLNRILVGKCGKQFITACYIYFDWTELTYRFSHAAHHSILHFSYRTDEVFHRRTRGRLIGVWEGMIYQEEEYPFESGDIFLIYSDGIIEVGNERDEFPREEYLEVILKTSEKEWRENSQKESLLSKIEDRIMSYLKEWRGNDEFEDDISFVLLRVKNSEIATKPNPK